MQAASKDIELIYRMEENIPGGLIGDPVRLSQILSNLISNAIKFTPEGKVELNIYEESRTDHIIQLRFFVSDTGIGIPQDKVDGLFESFHQLDSSTTRKYGGTGLGLAIVKKLIEIMGGSIKVRSTEGKGRCF